MHTRGKWVNEHAWVSTVFCIYVYFIKRRCQNAVLLKKNRTVAGELTRNWKECNRRRSWPSFKAPPRQFSEGAEGNHEKMPGWFLKRQTCEPRPHWSQGSLSVPFIGVSGVQCAEHSPPFLSYPFVFTSLCFITFRDNPILRNIKFYRVYMKLVKPSFLFSTFRGVDCTAFYPTTAQSTTIKRFSFSHVPPPCFGLNMVILREAPTKEYKNGRVC